jgi:hypothetical protein
MGERVEVLAADMPSSIAFCPCGNLQIDGLNFTRVAGGGLSCAACGAVSKRFEYIPVSDHEATPKVRDAEIEFLRQSRSELLASVKAAMLALEKAEGLVRAKDIELQMTGAKETDRG